MRPFHDYDLSKVIESRWIKVQEKVDSMTTEVIMANELDTLADNICQEFFIRPVTIFEEDFSKRTVRQGKIKIHNALFNIDRTEKECFEEDGIIADFYFPYQGDKILFQSRASTYSISGYPEIFVDDRNVYFRIRRSLSEMATSDAKGELLKKLENNIETIKVGLSYANKDAIVFNNRLKTDVRKLLETKKKKEQSIFDIATMLDVPIEKKDYEQTHIPLIRSIAPGLKHYETSNCYDIADSDYKDILNSIKHTGSTLERNPASFKSQNEEDLRNIFLTTLNSNYKGNATGETFRNKGKTDICIERENRAAFVAECKMWTGQKEVSKAINQLDSYLTWRDCKTALIYFVRRKNFFKTLDAAEEALRAYEGMKNVTVHDKNEFDCLFLSKANLSQQIKMRVMLFNLYCEG